jgi:hypothetical protein
VEISAWILVYQLHKSLSLQIDGFLVENDFLSELVVLTHEFLFLSVQFDKEIFFCQSTFISNKFCFQLCNICFFGCHLFLIFDIQLIIELLKFINIHRPIPMCIFSYLFFENFVLCFFTFFNFPIDFILNQ